VRPSGKHRRPRPPDGRFSYRRRGIGMAQRRGWADSHRAPPRQGGRKSIPARRCPRPCGSTGLCVRECCCTQALRPNAAVGRPAPFARTMAISGHTRRVRSASCPRPMAFLSGYRPTPSDCAGRATGPTRRRIRRRAHEVGVHRGRDRRNHRRCRRTRPNLATSWSSRAGSSADTSGCHERGPRAGALLDGSGTFALLGVAPRSRRCARAHLGHGRCRPRLVLVPASS
jgi:hypothetical protein